MHSEEELISNPEPLAVLMVDDKPADGEMVRRYLMDESIPWSVELEVRQSLEEALSTLRDNTFDLLFVDYQFPFGNGFDVLERLRHEGFDGPAVMLTARGSETVAAQAVKQKLYDYIPKNELSPSRLKESLDAILSEPDFVFSPSSPDKFEQSSAEQYATVQPTNQLFAELSSKDKDQEPLDFLFLNIAPGGVQFTEASLTEVLIQFFQKHLLEPLRFFHVHGYTFLAVLEKPLKDYVTLDDPDRKLPERFSRAVSPDSEASPVPCRMLISEWNANLDDPARPINDCLDRTFDIPLDQSQHIHRMSLP